MTLNRNNSPHTFVIDQILTIAPMFGITIKKRLSEDQLSNIFVNGIFESVENGFEDVAVMINNDITFVVDPKVNPENKNEFALIVLAANISIIESAFDPEYAELLRRKIFEKLAKVYGRDAKIVSDVIKDYQDFMARVNRNSRNYANNMALAIFEKYDLNKFQDEFFKRQNACNPMFKKRLGDIMANFVWDWDELRKKYKF